MGGLLSGGFGLALDKANIADPELTTLSGLYVYLWICGVDIKVTLFCSSVYNSLNPGVKLVRYHDVKASSFKIVGGLVPCPLTPKISM